MLWQHEGGVNPTESMTRALISDDSIARQGALGPVQLGYVSHAQNAKNQNAALYALSLWFCIAQVSSLLVIITINIIYLSMHISFFIFHLLLTALSLFRNLV